MGCDDIMKFFETTLEIDASSLPSFVTSCVNIIVVAPLRLTQEVSKKIMYLKHSELESVLFTAAIIAFGITGVNSIISVAKGTFSLFSGRFPIVIQLASAILLTVLFAVFNSLNSLLFNTFESTAIKECEAIKTVEPKKNEKVDSEETGVISNVADDFVYEDTKSDEVESISEPITSTNSATEDINNLLDGIGIDQLLADVELEIKQVNNSDSQAGNQKVLNAIDVARGVIAENDTYTPPALNIPLDSTVLNHVNETEGIVKELVNMGSQCVAYSDAELEALQNRIKAIQPEASYFNSDFMSKFALSDEEDEEVTLMAPIPELEENSTLL